MGLARLALILALSIPVFAQINNPDVIYVDTAPAGSCASGSTLRVVKSTGVIYSCQSGMWAAVTGGGGGGPLPFDQVTSGTNMNHGLVCGAGCVMNALNGGFINANEINGVVVPLSAPLLGTDSSGRPIQAVNGSLSGTLAVDEIEPNATTQVAIVGSSSSSGPLAILNSDPTGASGADYYDSSGAFAGGVWINNASSTDPNDFYFYLQGDASEVFSTGGIARFTLSSILGAFTVPATINSASSTSDTLQLIRNAASGENMLMSNGLTNGVVDIGYSGTGALWRAGIGNALETSSGIANKFYIRNQTSGTWGIVVDTAGQVAVGIQPVYPTLFPCRLNVGSGSAFCVDDFGAASAKKLTVTGPGLIDSLATEVRTITVAHDTEQTNDFFIPCDTTANAVSFDLSSIPVTGQIMAFVKTDASANTCTLNGNGFLIGSASTLVLGSQYEGVSLQYSGTKWLVSSYFNPTTLAGYCPLTGCTFTGMITAPNENVTGTLGAGLLAISNYCVAVTSPSTCGTNTSGGVAFPIGASGTQFTVNSTKITANSKIMIQGDASIATTLGIAGCNGVSPPVVISSRASGTSFTFTTQAAIATTPACYTFTIIG